MFYFLCASLPGLVFGRTPDLTLARFDELCREQMSPEEFAGLEKMTLTVSRDPEAAADASGVRGGFIRFEQYLRTRIAERRSAERDEEKGSPLPDPAEYFGEIDTAVAQAAAMNDPLEREKLIDHLRWQRIDDLEAGHEFDFEQLCCYRLKLAILEKYRRRDAGTGKTNFNAAVDGISAAAPVSAGA